jgi:hypothetical protein
VFDAERHAVHVDAEGARKQIAGHIFKADAERLDARVVHGDVEFSKSRDGCVERSGDFFFTRNIRFEKRKIIRRWHAIDNEHVRACFAKALRDRATDSRRAAGHERGFPA